MKKAIIGVVVLLVIVAAAVLMMPKKKVIIPPVRQVNKVAHVMPWNGAESRPYNMTFIRSGHQLTLISSRFLHLDTPTTDVTFDFVTPKAPGTGIPRWLTPKAFIVRAIDGTTWIPLWKPSVHGAIVTFTLQLKGLPTRLIASHSLGLVLRVGGEPFSIGLAPPEPPAGHKYAENAHRPDASPPTISISKAGKGRVRVVANDDIALARVTINTDGKRKAYATTSKTFVKVISLRGKRRLHSVEAVAKDSSGKHSADKTFRIR
jgi:hypothetical protein